MKKNIDLKIQHANKLIFVRDYENAKNLLIEIVTSEEGKDDFLAHLRLVELAVKLEIVEKVMSFYQDMYASRVLSEKVFTIVKSFLRQHGNIVSKEDSIREFVDLLEIYPVEPAVFYAIGFGLEQLQEWDRSISNYEKALSIDSQWYPCYFGLSQIYYNLNLDDKGDHFFYLYEKQAPYNLYGNFDTHRKLSNDFLENEQYGYAHVAIESLVQWWVENKGTCPKEIKIFEALTKARISAFQGNLSESENQKKNGLSIVTEVLRLKKFDNEALYFIAKVLEEHTEFEISLKIYKKIIRNGDADPAIIYKIGSQFLSLGQSEIAFGLFDEAARYNPTNAEILFGRLVSNLRKNGVDVESYLSLREEMQRLLGHNNDKVRLFSILHNLLALFGGDADIHYEMAKLQKDMGNNEIATNHINSVLSLGDHNQGNYIRAASFFLSIGDINKSHEIAAKVTSENHLNAEQLGEYYYLQSSNNIHLGRYDEASNCLSKLLLDDPWNVTFLTQLIFCKMMRFYNNSKEFDDILIRSLLEGDDKKLDWAKYDQITSNFKSSHENELVYHRSKLRLIYIQGHEKYLLDFVYAAINWNPMVGGGELMKLLNTNFDSPNVYYALSVLFAEQWQLQVSSMWAEQALLHPKTDDSLRRRIYLKMADNYLWQGKNSDRALQYAMFARSDESDDDRKTNTVIGHAYLRQGKPKEAGLHLQQGESDSLETKYLKGLLEYRNGANLKASIIWKPLLTMRTESIKDHHIKKELLKYYFEVEPYLKVN